MTQPSSKADPAAREQSPASGALLPADRDWPELVGTSSMQKMLDLLMHEAPPFWLANRASELLFANRAYQDIAGHQLLPKQKDAIAQVLATGRPITVRDSAEIGTSTRHFRAHVYPIADRSGEPVAIAGLLIDATPELKALAEAQGDRRRFLDIVRSTSDWVWETDREGRLTFVSERAGEALGRPAAALRGLKLDDLAADGASTWPAKPERPQPFRDAGFRAVGADGRIRHLFLSGVPIFDQAGAFVGYRGTGTDVTHRLVAEEALREHQVKLEQALAKLKANTLGLEIALTRARLAVEAKNEFLATMSHELRTPLNAIIGFAEIMTAGVFGELDQRYSGYATDIGAAGRQLLGLIENILTLAESRESKLAIEARPTGLRPLLEKAIAVCARPAAAKNLMLAPLPADLDAQVLVDAELAKEVFIQLLDNAIKFTPAGGAFGIAIEALQQRHLELVVWDTGPGIAPDKQVLLFDPFQQIHDTIYRRGFGGVGVGLALARDLARSMGGDVKLAETSSRGSRFRVTLALAPA
jgi:PAS domain S-box-containing protein